MKNQWWKMFLAACLIAYGFRAWASAAVLRDEQVEELDELGSQAGYLTKDQPVDLRMANQRDFKILKENLSVLVEHKKMCSTISYDPESRVADYIWEVKDECAPCGKALKRLDARLQKMSRRPIRKSMPVWDNSTGEKWREMGQMIGKYEDAAPPGRHAARWDSSYGETWRIVGEAIGITGKNIFDQLWGPDIKIEQVINGMPIENFLLNNSAGCNEAVKEFDGNISVITLEPEGENSCTLELTGMMRETSTGGAEIETAYKTKATTRCVVKLPCADLEIGFIAVTHNASEAP
ncbi:MAG: hypothetical protein HY547_08385 [Elusimicrobia bacterium]|nr:hypothetical protein [Elusimicrobiota bacterium]